MSSRKDHRHFCITCSPGDAPGAGCINCRQTGYDQTPCVNCPGSRVVVHYLLAVYPRYERTYARCGVETASKTTEQAAVTCKRCLKYIPVSARGVTTSDDPPPSPVPDTPASG